MNNTQKGEMGEAFVCKYLGKEKLKILARNYRAKKGEIDIIAQEKDTIVFVEVKLRTSTVYGSGAEAVTYKKQDLLRQTAYYYINEKGLYDYNFRFDVAEILLNDGKFELNYIKNAF